VLLRSTKVLSSCSICDEAALAIWSIPSIIPCPKRSGCASTQRLCRQAIPLMSFEKPACSSFSWLPPSSTQLFGHMCGVVFAVTGVAAFQPSDIPCSESVHANIS
jgi:hypothetical protein